MEILLTVPKYAVSVLVVIAVSALAASLSIFPEEARAATSLSKPPNNLGLIGYWPMDEATSTSVGDFSGNGYNGVFATDGAENAVWDYGKRGNALYFSGGGGYVRIANQINNGTSEFTIAGWVRYLDAGSGHGDGVFVKENDAGTQADFDYYIDSSGVPTFYDDSVVTSDMHGATSINDAGWHYIALTRSGTSLKFYLDGALDVTQTIGSGSFLNRNLPSRIGDDPAIHDMNGYIDDLRLYNRALSSAEVAGLYKGGTTGAARANASSKKLTANSTLASGLVALWTFDGGDMRWTSATAGVAYDGSGNNNNGTLTSMSRTSAPVIGKLGQALALDGTSEVSAGDVNATDGVSKLSIAFWAKPTSLPSDFFSYVSKYNNTNGWSVYSDGSSGLSGTNKGINFIRDGVSGNEGGTSAAGGVVSIGSWTHIVVVFDETLSPPNCLKIYANGVSQSITYIDDGTGMCGGTTSSNSAALVIGGEPAGGPDPNFVGAMDDVRIYNRALSGLEVQQLYNLGKAIIR